MQYLDMIILKLGAGAGLIKNEFVTDISSEIGLAFEKKGLIKNEFYASENMFFLFDQNQNLKKDYSSKFELD